MITRYVTSRDGTRIAVHVQGDESRPALLTVAPWATVGSAADLVGFDAHEPYRRRRFWIGYDRRGTGASQRDVVDVGLDAQLSDIEAVLHILSIDSCDITAYFEGAPIAIAYAAKHPERVKKLVLWQPFVDGRDGLPPERVQSLKAIAQGDWPLAARTLANLWIPRGPVEAQRTMAREFRERLSPDTMVRYLDEYSRIDVREDAKRVTADTLVLHPAGSGTPARPPQDVAALIPNALLQHVEQTMSFISSEAVAGNIMDFLDGTPGASATSATTASTAIILFADIVDSTALTERMGDAAFRAKARALDTALRAVIAEAGGTTIEAKTLGDGVLATFPAASQAIDAALRCGAAGEEQGLPLHLGLHAGDVIREQDNVFGGAVNIAARISGLSAPGEVLVSDTVRSLARTSAGVRFEDRGEHALKGVADAQRVYAVRPVTGAS